jgi:hypothetical protein
MLNVQRLMLNLHYLCRYPLGLTNLLSFAKKRATIEALYFIEHIRATKYFAAAAAFSAIARLTFGTAEGAAAATVGAEVLLPLVAARGNAVAVAGTLSAAC